MMITPARILLTYIALGCLVLANGYGNTTVQYHEHLARHPGPWSQILEDWVVLENGNFNIRQPKKMKLGDKQLTVMYERSEPNKRDVSETDLYLLSAIEKLVYRVDFLEKRLRRTEELLYYVISGNHKVEDACPSNYTRVGENCYHFSYRQFDWKSSASFCRGLGGNLVELDTVEENQNLITYLQTTNTLKGKNFWTAGLNPGLLWIWAGSAKPVHRDTESAIKGEGRISTVSVNTRNNKLYLYLKGSSPLQIIIGFLCIMMTHCLFSCMLITYGKSTIRDEIDPYK